MSGPMWLKEPAAAAQDNLPYVPRRRRPGWAAADPLDELAERLEDFVAAAVHPDEIAALLESDGLTDEQIRLRYGREDSFALAEELYGRVERRFPEPAVPPDDPSAGTLLACLLRGVIFALPGLGYVLAAPLLAGGRSAYGLPAGAIPLLAGALAGWTWNQALSHRAYSWLGLGDRPAAARSLLLGAPAGALLATAAALASAGPSDGPALLFTAGQSLYLAAATVLLVLARDRALLLALLPLAAGASCAALQPLPSWVRIVLLVTSATAAVCCAAWALRPSTPASRRAGRTRGRPAANAAGPALIGCRRAGRRRWWSAVTDVAGRGGGVRQETGPATGAPWLGGSLPYGLFGLGTGTLVLHVALDIPPLAVALTLSMGPAEWLLHRFRADSLAGLRASTTPRGFRVSVAATLARCLAGYLGALSTFAAVAMLLWPGGGRGPGGAALAGVLLLGVVLWTGLLLQAFGAVLSAAGVCCAAALVAVLVPDAALLVVPGTAAAVLAGLVCVLLGRITAHR
ncbi:hypothetical protein [Streptomyces sp. NPDC059909]|uniref:hypothetical protein n=1 Tax=Streptomyces sp. NPDC059909 TaxID=3346998 RepID=UPI00365B71AD